MNNETKVKIMCTTTGATIFFLLIVFHSLSPPTLEGLELNSSVALENKRGRVLSHGIQCDFIPRHHWENFWLARAAELV